MIRILLMTKFVVKLFPNTLDLKVDVINIILYLNMKLCVETIKIYVFHVFILQQNSIFSNTVVYVFRIFAIQDYHESMSFMRLPSAYAYMRAVFN